MSHNYKWDSKKTELIFLILIFVFYLLWALVIPFGEGPDELMRYDIPKFLCKYGFIPHGEDPRIRNEIWGTSYAFSPILSYMISAVLMKITSFFTNENQYLIIAARIASCLFSTGTAFFCLKIGNKLLTKKLKWLFVFFVTLLPQFAFISSYVNCDAIAVFAVAWLIYGLILGTERVWDFRSCAFLGAGIGICLLTYYNTYGIILVIIIYCILNVLLNKDIKNKFRFILMRFLFVFAVSFLIAGWWFIRNYIIYDGDILGRSTARYYAEMFAVESLKPSNRMTPLKLGYTLKYMLIDLNWIKLTCRSFFGVFGRMTIFLNDKIYYIYYTIFLSGLFGTFIKNRTRNKKFYLLYLCMITMCIITIGISIYYSFTSDMQPQGRYCFPMLIPLCYLITLGLDNIFNKLRGRFKILTLYSLYFCLFSLSLYSLFFVVIPIYY